MGVISGILGNSSAADVKKIQKEFGPVLVEGEEIQRVYKYIRDYLVFTNTRLVIVEKKDLAGKKMAFQVFPYTRILHFGIEIGGHLDLDNKLNFFVAGMSDSITWRFNRFIDIYEIQVALASYCL